MAKLAPQGSIRPGSGSRMDYTPCVVLLGSLRASGWPAAVSAATVAALRGGGSPASACACRGARDESGNLNCLNKFNILK